MVRRAPTEIRALACIKSSFVCKFLFTSSSKGVYRNATLSSTPPVLNHHGIGNNHYCLLATLENTHFTLINGTHTKHWTLRKIEISCIISSGNALYPRIRQTALLLTVLENHETVANPLSWYIFLSCIWICRRGIQREFHTCLVVSLSLSLAPIAPTTSAIEEQIYP